MSFRSRLLLVGVLLAVPGVHTQAMVFQTRDEALAECFPGAAVERRSLFLTSEQLDAIRAELGKEFDQEIIYPYAATRDGALVGTAYFDNHRVRTLPQTLMVAVGPGGEVLSVKVLAFREPREYLAPARWYEQFTGKKLDAELALHRGIQGVTGATLTGRATLDAVRRVLAIHRVLQGSSP